MKSDDLIIIHDVDLRNRLNIIIQEVWHFWEQAPYTHFTNHGPSHSERIHQKLAQLNQELPEDQRLNEDEIFIVSAAAWLYEIGMQCTNLTPIVNFKYQAGVLPTFAQLQQIRERKHLLAERMILDSISGTHDGSYHYLGLTPDRHTKLIADVCRGISNEPLKNVPEQEPVRGVMVRLRLLVALLRLADQLYIDSSRVNLELLQAANLPPGQLAHWWSYHYTQTLPIHRGQIRFHYFLPSVHKPLLGHIRALIEPAFEHNKNPTLSYLWKEHGLRLIPQKHPNVSFEQQAGFQHEMSPGLVSYLRENVTPIIEDKGPEPEEEEKKVHESLLLVLDYENFLLQLGLQGYFPTPDEIGHLLVTLFTEAKNQYPGLMIDGLAVGHWKRPDLAPIGRLLRASLYRLLTAENHEKSSYTIMRELLPIMHSANPPKQTLLIAPQEDLAPIVMYFDERKQAVSPWISDLPGADIYLAVGKDVQFLPQILGVTDPQSINPRELELVQAACILKLDDSMDTAKDGLPLEEISSVLEGVEQIQRRVDWWRLWLINKDILKLELSQNGHVLKLNPGHPAVIAVRLKRSTVLKATPNPLRTSAFISYSHKDRRILEELHTHLAPHVRMGVLEVWDDTKILPGTKWREEIKRALQSAKVAVLLVSADFLASDFIATNVLPPLLTAAKQEGAIILCVILRPCAFKYTDLAQFQTVNTPSNPLSNMTKGRRDEVWTRVAELVRDGLMAQSGSKPNNS